MKIKAARLTQVASIAWITFSVHEWGWWGIGPAVYGSTLLSTLYFIARYRR